MGNFWGDFSRGLASGVDIGTKMQQQRREQEEFERKKADWKRADEHRLQLEAAGNVIDDPNNVNGLMSAEDYKALQARLAKDAKRQAKDAKKGALPALGADIAPERAPAVLDTKPLVEGAVDQAPSQWTQPQLVKPAPKTDDYTPVVVGDRVMYAPRQRVKQLTGPDLYRAQARAVALIDPEMGRRLEQGANELETSNLEAKTRVLEHKMMAARRVAELGGGNTQKGLDQLAAIYRQDVPDLGDVEFKVQKGGAIEVVQYVNTQGGRVEWDRQVIPAVDPETGIRAIDRIFLTAKSLTSPEGFVENFRLQADLATKGLTQIATRQAIRQQEELFPLQQQQAREAIETSRFNRRNQSISTYYDTGMDPSGQLPAGADHETAIEIGQRFGKVTSTVRSASHNKRVGGVANSRHLASRGGRAIDIARAKGVSHADIEAAYREAGFHIVESLDEGDHSHIAWELPSGLPPRVRDQLLIGGGGAGGKADAKAIAEHRKSINDYVAKGLANSVNEPGTPERAAEVERLKAEAMDIYGVPDDLPVAADVSSGGQGASPTKAALPLKVAVKQPAKPAPKPAPKREQPKQSAVVKEAQGALRLGGVAGQRARQQFEDKYGMPPATAVKNPKAVANIGKARVKTALPGKGVSRAQLEIDANAAIAQGPKAKAEFQRKYGMPPENFVRKR